MVKSCLVSVPINWPEGSFTVARIRTRLTSTRIVLWAKATIASPTAALAANHRRTFIPFSFHPDFAVFEVFFLPDRHQPLKSIDAFERSFERRLAMRCG